jgi:hypothetical protein
MFAKVRATLLRPFRRLRTFLLSETWSVGAEARDLAREARDEASAARDAVAERARESDGRAEWIADEIRKARVYGGLASMLDRVPSLRQQIGMSEVRVFSQNGEDGVLRFLLERLGIGTGTFLEIGAERHEANCLLLALHDGWSGVFVDGDASVAASLTDLLRHTPEVRVVHEMVDPATVEEAVERWGVPRELEVLSIDVDGADYYVWQAIGNVRAQVVVIEYNAALDPDRPLVQRPDIAAWDGTVNHGCSVGALRLLAEEKGYAVVYLESSGTNAFLVANEHLAELGPLPPVRLRAPNYHLRPNAGHPGDLDEARFVEIGEQDR